MHYNGLAPIFFTSLIMLTVRLKTFIQITPVSRWTSAEKSGRKAIKFAPPTTLYFLNICLCNYIVLSSSSSDLKAYLLMWENIWSPAKKTINQLVNQVQCNLEYNATPFFFFFFFFHSKKKSVIYLELWKHLT